MVYISQAVGRTMYQQCKFCNKPLYTNLLHLSKHEKTTDTPRGKKATPLLERVKNTLGFQHSTRTQQHVDPPGSGHRTGKYHWCVATQGPLQAHT